MDIEPALKLAKRLIVAQTGKPLDDLPTSILRGALEGKSFSEIAESYSCNESYAKQVSSKLCKLLSAALGEPIAKRNLISTIEQRLRLEKQNSEAGLIQVEGPIAPPSVYNPNFVGREEGKSFALPEKIAPVRNWVGRVEELNTLKAQILDPETRAITITAVCVVGLAGIGKTTLASQLVRQLQAENAPFVAAVWESLLSVTGKPPRFQDIIDSLLLTLSNGEITRTVTTLDDDRRKIERLVKLLKDRPCLVVLDNVETVLQTRQAKRAGYFADDCAEYALLFQQLVETEHQSRVIFTSREILAQLKRRETRTFQLGGLDPNSAVTLLQSFDLIATQEELTKLAKRYEGHPKALEIIAALIQEDFQERVDRFLQDRKWLLIRDLESLIDEVINRLSEDEYVCLRQVSVYQTREHPLLDEGITAQMPDVSERDLKENIILALRRRQLLDYDPNDECYQMHPLVQEKASYLLDSETSRIAHRQAYQYFISIAQPETEWKEFEDVQPLLRAYYHACQAKDWHEAALAISITDKYLRQHGYFDLLIDFYIELIPPNWKDGEHLVTYSKEYGEILLHLGNAYHAVSQWEKANNYYQQCLSVARNNGERPLEAKVLCYMSLNDSSLGDSKVKYFQESLAIAIEINEPFIECKCLEYLGIFYMGKGWYDKAVEFYSKSLKVARENGFEEEEGIAFGNLGDAYGKLGKYELAIKYLKKYFKIAEKTGNPKRIAYALGGLAQVSNKIEKFTDAIDYAQECKRLAHKIMDGHCEGHAIILLGIAHKGLGKYEDAISLFTRGLKLTRKVGSQCHEADALCELGMTYRYLGKIAQSIENLQSSCKIFHQIGSQAEQAKTLVELAKSNAIANTISQELIQDYLSQAEQICLDLQIPLLAEVQRMKADLLKDD
jgi:tetratricopeptide (TPR) repeat protein